MPILDIQLVGDPEPSIRSDLAHRLAEAAGRVLQSRPNGTWVKVTILPKHDYAENGSDPDDSTDSVLPVFVSIIKRHLPPPDQLATEATSLTHAIAEVCQRPAENVHLIYQPPGAGRVVFGGVVVGS